MKNQIAKKIERGQVLARKQIECGNTNQPV